MNTMFSFIKRRVYCLLRQVCERALLGRLRLKRCVGKGRLFDAAWYVNRYQLRDVEDPLHHYMTTGASQGLNPNPLFDSTWYLTRYPDVRQAGMNPLMHYMLRGARLGYKPNPLFDGAWYLQMNVDVWEARMNPLAHYLASGAAELRDPNPLFDARWYVDRNSEAMELYSNPLLHFLETGSSQGLNPGPYFDGAWYAKTYLTPDEPCAAALAHFLEQGWAAGHRPSCAFDAAWYVSQYTDVAEAKVDPLFHFLTFGRREGRSPKCMSAYFEDEKRLRDRLAGLPAGQSSVACTIVLPLQEARALAEIRAGAGASTVFECETTGAVGIEPVSYPSAPYIARLRDVLALAGTRYVVAQGHLVHDEACHFNGEDAAAVRYFKARRSDHGRLRLDMGIRQAAWADRGINLMHEYSNNYFHFLAETAPRLMLVEEAGLDPAIPLFIEADLHKNMRDLLTCVNVARRPVVTLESGVLYKVQEMYLPSDTSVVVDAYYGGPIARQSAIDVGRVRRAVQYCKQRYACAGSGKKRKVYATRRGKIRQLLNQAELEARLVKNGFDIVNVEAMDIETQIRIFQEAEVVVGPTGAQLTNIVWCNPGTRVIVLASNHPSHQLYLWSLLGQVAQADVSIVLGPRAYVRDDKYSVHDDYRVDVQEVLAMLGAPR